MNNIFFILLVLCFISCERHQMESKVEEVEVIQLVELSSTEDMHKAYIEKDYEKLDELLQVGNSIDLPVYENKTLLAMAIIDQNLKMIDFLMSFNANTELRTQSMNSDEEISIRELISEIPDEKVSHVILKIINNKLSDVSDFLFFNTLENITSEVTVDIEWINRLVKAGVNLVNLDEDQFGDLFIQKAFNITNSNEFYRTVLQGYDEEQYAAWEKWTMEPFVKGRYRRAKCKVPKDLVLHTFQDFVDLCAKRYRKRVLKSESKFWPRINLRNILLNLKPNESKVLLTQ